MSVQMFMKIRPMNHVFEAIHLKIRPIENRPTFAIQKAYISLTQVIFGPSNKK